MQKVFTKICKNYTGKEIELVVGKYYDFVNEPKHDDVFLVTDLEPDVKGFIINLWENEKIQIDEKVLIPIGEKLSDKSSLSIDEIFILKELSGGGITTFDNKYYFPISCLSEGGFCKLLEHSDKNTSAEITGDGLMVLRLLEKI